MQPFNKVMLALISAGLFQVMSVAQAATVTVTTAMDEDNGRTSNVGTDKFPLSQGCSFREALQTVANNDGQPYQGCSAATQNGPNTIAFDNDYTIVINAQVPDPGDINGVAMKRNGTLPNVTGTPGALTIDGVGHSDKISCESGAAQNEAAPKLIDSKSSADLTINNLAFADCSASGGGIAITSTGSALTMNTVSFSNIHSNSGGAGGAINFTGPATFSAINVTFDNNGTKDTTGATPNNANADGGAIWMSGIANVAGQNVGDPPQIKPVNFTNVTFTRNTAEHNGGAIFVAGAGGSLGYTIQMTNVIFGGPLMLGNTANGGLQADQAFPNGEDGGGAIWIKSNNSEGAADLFLMNACQFISNSAPNGYGGAILLSFNSTLTYQAAGQEIPPIISAAPPLPVPIGLVGGIFGSNFAGNSAGGDPNGANSPNNINGSGGAIYSRGRLSVLQSSFVLNSSSKNSGGAIANNGGGNNPITLGNVTMNQNTAATNGGALANFSGSITLLNDTVSGNTANGIAPGGGGALWNNGSGTDIQVRNSILGNSSAGGNCVGSLTDNGNNLQYTPDTGCGTLTVGNPNLASASVSPGPNFLVLSMAIQGDHSPAQGTGDEATCEAAPILKFDTTGIPVWRPQGDAACDIGAFESSTTFPVQLQSFGVD